jgi:hypothetical protein
MIVIPFVLNNNGKNVKRTVRQVITGAGAFGFEQLLRATGFDDVANSLKSGNPQPFDTDKLVGQKLNVTVETDTYNGQLTDKITGYLKA